MKYPKYKTVSLLLLIFSFTTLQGQLAMQFDRLSNDAMDIASGPIDRLTTLEQKILQVSILSSSVSIPHQGEMIYTDTVNRFVASVGEMASSSLMVSALSSSAIENEVLSQGLTADYPLFAQSNIISSSGRDDVDVKASKKRSPAIESKNAQVKDPFFDDDFNDDFKDEYDDAFIRNYDPLEWLNRPMFYLNDRINEYALGPVSSLYTTVLSEPIRDGISNFFQNIKFPIRFVNSVLQGDDSNAGIEVNKFLLNTTAGILGFIKISDRYESLASTKSEDLGQTFGHWGIGNGPYIVLPILGPTTLRDGLGMFGDGFLSPINYLGKGEALAANIADVISGLPQNLKTYKSLTSNTIDPYSALQDAYLQRRSMLVDE